MEQQTDIQTQLTRGDTLLKQGDVREAAEEFANVVRMEPGNPGGHLGLAEASLALGDFVTTQQACAQVQQLAPQSAEAALARALLAVLGQRFDLALTEVEQSIELDPTMGYAHALRAFVFRRLGQRYDGALAEARAGRTWGTTDLDHLFAALPKPEPAPAPLPTAVPGATFAPQVPTAPGPRTWDQRPAYQRRMVQTRFAFRGVPIVTYTLIAINVGVFLLDSLTRGLLYQAGAGLGILMEQDPTQAYRLLTSMFLHANLLHIAANMFSLLFVGVWVERMFGSGRFTIIYFASGLIGGLAQAFLSPGGPFVGASGAIFGIFGAFGAFLLMRRRSLGPAVNAMIGQWLFWLGLNLFISFSPGIALWGHLGGLATGFALGALLTSMAGRQRSRVNY